jgi:Rieske Fe-S protein
LEESWREVPRLELSRRTLLKLLLGISGIVAFFPFASYVGYFSFRPEANTGKKQIAKLSDLPPNSALYFQWPSDSPRDVNILIVDDSMKLRAYNARCTHLGCQLDYKPGLRLIMCPCHGSMYDPASGKATRGPAVSSLTVIKLEVDKDEIYAVGQVEDQS